MSRGFDVRRPCVTARTMAYLRTAVRRIVRHVRPKQVILFGSCAYGRPKDGSDLDLLIIARSREHPFERERRVDELLSDRTTAMDIMVRTPEEIEACRRGFQPFWDEVLTKGKTLY